MYRGILKRGTNLIEHKFWGIIIFLAVIYGVFTLAVKYGGVCGEFLANYSENSIMNVAKSFLLVNTTPAWLIAMVAGFSRGVAVTLSFVPVLLALFFCLDLLQQVGYLSRAAQVMDRFMAFLGLPGQSLVPMVIGFGCNVPAVLGTRILPDYKQRIVTILMTPFMSCSSRLAIYTVFVAAFFKEQGHNIIFSLYIIGILVAILTGLAMHKFLQASRNSAIPVVLPEYQWPNIKSLLRSSLFQVKQFFVRTSKVIIPICMVISFVFSFNAKDNAIEQVGRKLSPIFAPIGIDENNWPAILGLGSGIVAKEVMLGSLHALYAADKQADSYLDASDNLHELQFNIAKSFANKASAYAYLLFVLLYFPCISVLVAIAKELNVMWAVASVVWTTALAYTVAVVFYQVATFPNDPLTSMQWLGSIAMLYITVFVGINNLGKLRKQIYEPIPIKVL